MSDVAKFKVPLSTDDPNSYVIESLSSADEGRYICSAKNTLGEDEAFVDINMLGQ